MLQEYQTKLNLCMSLLSLFYFVIQKHINLEYSVDKGLYLIDILFKMSHVVCRLPLYTKYETLGIPAYISGMYVFKEVKIVKPAVFINCKPVPNFEGILNGK
jgi:hypothetical protein